MAEKIAKRLNLTDLSSCAGWAAKLGPGDLKNLISKIPLKKDGNLLVGFKNNDDAAVYKIDKKRSLVFTVDFFTPIVDDPLHFGKIAAVNSISDVYAMGGSPFLALNVMGFPIDDIPSDVFSDILRGAAEKSIEAGVVIGGGHSVRDAELKFGLSVAGFVDNNAYIDNSRAMPGDVIILTKPIGTGIITTAQKRTHKVPKSVIDEIIVSMELLNKNTRDAMVEYKIKTATDITGFGLLGHLYEIASASHVDLEIYSKKIPLFSKTIDYAKKGFLPGGSYANHKYLSESVVYSDKVDECLRFILCDAQTSGGIAIFCPEQKSDKLVSLLKWTEICCEIIGRVKACGHGKIFVE